MSFTLLDEIPLSIRNCLRWTFSVEFVYWTFNIRAAMSNFTVMKAGAHRMKFSAILTSRMSPKPKQSSLFKPKTFSFVLWLFLAFLGIYLSTHKRSRELQENNEIPLKNYVVADDSMSKDVCSMPNYFATFLNKRYASLVTKQESKRTRYFIALILYNSANVKLKILIYFRLLKNQSHQR